MATPAFFQPTGTIPKNPVDTAFPTVRPDPPIVDKIGATGERTLWVVFVIMLVATILFFALAWAVPASKRLYHTLTTLIVVISTLSYFAMAVHSGVTWKHSLIKQEHDHGLPPTYKHFHRQIYFARYIDWILTTPLIVMSLSTLGAVSGANILTGVAGALVWVLSGLFSAFGTSKAQRWGWFAISVVSFLVVGWQFFAHGRVGANARSQRAGKAFLAIGGYTAVVLLLYTVSWGIAAGHRRFSVDREVIVYAVLDILAKPIFGLWLLLTVKRLPETGLELGGFWSYGFASEGAIRIPESDEGA